MGIRFLLDWKWGFSIRSPFLNNSSIKQQSSSVKGRETSYESTRSSILSFTPEESETLRKDPLKAYTSSFGALETSSFGALQIVPNGSNEIKMNVAKGLDRALYNQIDDIRMPVQDDTPIFRPGLQVKENSRFNLLYKNIEKIEEIFVDEHWLTLERDILLNLGKLGALNLFHACLSRTLNTPSPLHLPIQLTKHPGDCLVDGAIDDQVGNIIVRSGKKEERKSRREKTSEKAAKISALLPSSKINNKVPRRGSGSTLGPSKSRRRRHIIARNESELSRRVKDVADLERIRTTLEEESGQLATIRNWAEAARVDEKVLQQRLHYGWFCRDELLRSTRSLIVYLARNYRGLGISLEDLYQAGKMGVLKGAERFDHTRGYQFSTYVQYWIRKSMSTLVAQNSREIHIPVTLSRGINQIKKARRVLYNLHGRYPDDDEIACLTGLSIAKIRFARKCPRIVGSIEQKMGDNLNIKFMEFTSDKSMKTPEETCMRRHMRKDMYELLQGLLPRESQVLILRYGFWDGQCRSLEEIARLFKCTKEWIRKIEKSALTKVRKEEVQRNLSQYLNLQL